MISDSQIVKEFERDVSVDELHDAYDEIILDDITFEVDKLLVTGTLRIKKGAHVRIKNGARLTIKCQTLIVDGKCVFAAQGVDGQDGRTPQPFDDWISGMHHNDHDRRHREWFEAGITSHPHSDGKDAVPGTDGGPGGTVEIRFQKLGTGTILGDVDAKVSGGRGGKAAAGGLGRKLVCGHPGPHAHFVAGHWGRRPSGREWPGGRDGRDGEFILKKFGEK